MPATPTTRFVAPGAFVCRIRDGMLGKAGARHASQRSAGWLQNTQEITWLGEWTLDEWDPTRHNALRIELLDGPEAAAAAARFAALTCPVCDGSGLRDPRRERSEDNRCPNEACQLGRLLGVEPAFDASYADYRAYLDRATAQEAAYASAGTAHEAARAAQVTAWADAVLAYPGACVECGTHLAAGTTAQRRKAEHWEVRCAAHVQGGPV